MMIISEKSDRGFLSIKSVKNRFSRIWHRKSSLKKQQNTTCSQKTTTPCRWRLGSIDHFEKYRIIIISKNRGKIWLEPCKQTVGQVYGDYPDVVQESYSNRNPNFEWDNPRLARNYNTPLGIDEIADYAPFIQRYDGQFKYYGYYQWYEYQRAYWMYMFL